MADPQYRLDVTTSDGKYTVRQPAEGPAIALRHGKPWPAYEGKALPNLVLALAYDLAEAREYAAQLERSAERIASIGGAAMTRDLATIEAHIDRARTAARELYEARDIDLHMCDGSVRTGQHGVLDNIRNDLLALASGLEDAHAKLVDIEAGDELEPGFLADVIAERIRQITVEGFTAEHDDQHDCGELAIAGACYALAAGGNTGFTDRLWPWDANWWKPSDDPRRNLVKATALLIAEGERLDRRDGRTPSPAPDAPEAMCLDSMVEFQDRIRDWCIECFGAATLYDVTERNWRFLEEALELVQSLGGNAEDAHKLVDYVFGRPAGEPDQELGGAMVTLAALAAASGFSLSNAAGAEADRIHRPEMMNRIRAKHAAKPHKSPLPGDYKFPEPEPGSLVGGKAKRP